MAYPICHCEATTVQHVHVPKTDAQGQVVGMVWDEPETPENEIERRLRACEINLQNVWEVLNARNTADR